MKSGGTCATLRVEWLISPGFEFVRDESDGSGRYRSHLDTTGIACSMKRKHPYKKPEFINDLEARQRNIWMGDQIRNSGVFYRTVWHGRPDAPLVQRIGIGLFGLLFIAQVIGFLNLTSKDGDVYFGSFVSLPFLYIGCRLIRNSLRH